MGLVNSPTGVPRLSTAHKHGRQTHALASLQPFDGQQAPVVEESAFLRAAPVFRATEMRLLPLADASSDPKPQQTWEVRAPVSAIISFAVSLSYAHAG